MLGSTYGFLILMYGSYGVFANIKGELCTDISTYSPLEWHDGQECCKVPVGTPVCTTTTDRACIDVEETICRKEMGDEFEMTECPLNTKMVMRTPQTFTPNTHISMPHQFTHTKYNFTCENKTRQNCETIWVTNESGEKVSVPGTCEEVTWLDCFKTPYEATFDTIKHQPVPLPNIPYETCFEMIVPNVQMCFRVKKVLVSKCATVTTPKCTLVTTKSCKPTEGKRECISSGRVPWQERIHKEKCLKPDPDSDNHLDGDHHRTHQISETGSGFSIDLRQGRRAKDDQLFQDVEFEKRKNNQLDGRDNTQGETLVDRFFKLKSGRVKTALG